MSGYDRKDIERRMKGAVETLKHEFAGLRTGRANPALLDPITVDVYGASMPLNQLATIGAPEPRMLTVQVWDRNNVGAVEKAIRQSDLGLNPIVEGNLLRIPIPPLSEERRREMTKIAAKYAETARVAVRNVRRDGMEHIRRMEKEDHLGQDEAKRLMDEVQKLTDETIARIDELLKAKEEEIMKV
ncbi:MAG: ribosome recycling factor [Alphaproteobacteria bacterium]|nr:MAG: ribosome recycling factor [Alphaproteobacteria bacterium]